jgi:methylenetetrahydrofolate--tRNA-(uracil-5-)-methyltransferase
MLGGLYRYLSESDPRHFQPMNSNWGLVEPLAGHERDKVRKRERLALRAFEDFAAWMAALDGGDAERGARLETVALEVAP